MLTATGWLTKAVDTFALGCLYYYVLTGGRLHAFGNLHPRQRNILENDPRLEGLHELRDGGEEALTLIGRMLSPDPDTRCASSMISLSPPVSICPSLL